MYVAMSCYVAGYVIPDSLNIFLILLDPEDASEMITENDRFPSDIECHL
jgi:hypothetical protein